MINFKKFEIRFLEEFKNDLQKITPANKKLIQNKLVKILNDNSGNIKKVRNYPLGHFRIRFGQFRCFFEKDKKNKVIIFTAIRDRKNLY